MARSTSGSQASVSVGSRKRTGSLSSRPASAGSNYLRDTAQSAVRSSDDAAKAGRLRSNDRFARDRNSARGRNPVGNEISTIVHGKIKLSDSDLRSRKQSPSARHAAGCICELCTCGLHHCPTKAKQPAARKHSPFVGKSRYRDDYREYPLNEVQPPPSPAKKTTLWNASAHPTGVSNYKTDFPRYSTDHFRRDVSTPRKHEYKALPFEGTTRYRDDYTEKKPQPPPISSGAQPKQQWMPIGKMEGITTNRADFDKKALPTFEPPVRPESRRAPLPFEGDTEYRDRFPKHKIDPSVFHGRQSINPTRLWNSDNRGDKQHYSTTYRDNHDEKPIEYHTPKAPTTYKPNHLPTGTTTHRLAYVKHPVERTVSCPATRRDTQPWNRGQRFEHVTEHQATIGESGRAVKNCPAAVLQSQYQVCEPATDRSHIYFDEGTKTWY